MSDESSIINFTRNNCRLNNAFEELETLCVNVCAPRGILEHIQYFCGEKGTPEGLEARNDERVVLYRKIASLLYFYVRIADQFELVGFSANYIRFVEMRIDFYVMLRELVRCNARLIQLTPSDILYDSTIALFNNYLSVVRTIEKNKYSALGITYINHRLQHYIKIREVICFNDR